MNDTIRQDLKTAMLAKDETAVMTLRMLLSEVKYLEVAKGELTDSDYISVIQKELKKRREAAEGFRKGGREESALKEEDEAKILEKYLPQQMTDQQLQSLVDEAINEIGATSMSDMGKVMALVMSKAGQSVEGSRVSSMVRQKLTGQS
jgi:uncharacterized protein YqeY